MRVGPDGQVVSAQLLEATTPEMGQAALAMIDTWKFTPATKKDGTPCYAALTINHDFEARREGGGARQGEHLTRPEGRAP